MVGEKYSQTVLDCPMLTKNIPSKEVFNITEDWQRARGGLGGNSQSEERGSQVRKVVTGNKTITTRKYEPGQAYVSQEQALSRSNHGMSSDENFHDLGLLFIVGVRRRPQNLTVEAKEIKGVSTDRSGILLVVNKSYDKKGWEFTEENNSCLHPREENPYPSQSNVQRMMERIQSVATSVATLQIQAAGKNSADLTTTTPPF